MSERDEVQALQKLVSWLDMSNRYWMGRAKVPTLEGEEAVAEVALAFDDDALIVSAYVDALAAFPDNRAPDVTPASESGSPR